MSALPPGAPTAAASALRPAQRPRRLKTLRTVTALMLREMATTYGRSPGGYLWAVLEPAAAVALLTFVFSLALRAPSLGDNFPMFYATGYLPFGLYMTIQGRISTAIRFSRPLLAYPAVTFADAVIARFALHLLTQLMVACVVLGAIVVLYDLPLMLDLPTAIAGFALAALLGVGVGTTNCFLISVVPVWQNFWTIAMRPIFLISGVFFIYEDLPSGFRDAIWWNPLFHVTGLVRSAFYPTYDATYVSVLYVAAVGAVTLFLGLLLLGRWHREILAMR